MPVAGGMAMQAARYAAVVGCALAVDVVTGTMALRLGVPTPLAVMAGLAAAFAVSLPAHGAWTFGGGGYLSRALPFLVVNAVVWSVRSVTLSMMETVLPGPGLDWARLLGAACVSFPFGFGLCRALFKPAAVDDGGGGRDPS